MANETWKPPLPKTNPEMATTLQSLSQWLKVPWTHTFVVGYSGSSTSGSVADMPSPTATLQFKKLRDRSRLHFHLDAGAYSGAGSQSVQFYVRLNSVDNAVAFLYFNAGSTHLRTSGSCVVDDIPADTYTITIGWAVVGTITVDANDPFYLSVTETNEMPEL